MEERERQCLMERGGDRTSVSTAPGDNIPSECYENGTLQRGTGGEDGTSISSWESIDSNPRTL